MTARGARRSFRISRLFGGSSGPPFVSLVIESHPAIVQKRDGGTQMETVLQLVVALGIAISLYGFVQLASRTTVREEKLAPFWPSLYRIVFLREMPPDSGGGFSTSVNPDRKSRVGWFCLITGSLIQLVGQMLLPLAN